ncbi:MAG: 16S rRNA processing protein RimM [Ruminococcaceae bacterium]|nr:16S rRNA processing protein RimM [Oscillospiraceae bacterium]
MLKQYLEIGKIVGTHGVRGELRVECWCDSPQFMANFKTLYFNEGLDKIQVQSRPHKNIALVKIKGVDTVEQADLLRGRVLYVNRKDIKLPKGTNFIQDIIGLEVVDVDTKVVYGKVTEVIKTGANDVYEVKDENAKAYYIPVIKDVVVETNPKKGVVLIKPMKGIFDDED